MATATQFSPAMNGLNEKGAELVDKPSVEDGPLKPPQSEVRSRSKSPCPVASDNGHPEGHPKDSSIRIPSPSRNALSPAIAKRSPSPYEKPSGVIVESKPATDEPKEASIKTHSTPEGAKSKDEELPQPSELAAEANESKEAKETLEHIDSAPKMEKSPVRKSPARQSTPRKEAEESTPIKKTPVSTRKRKLVTEADIGEMPAKTPLLEAPLVIEGKRTRQRTERLSAAPDTVDRKEVDITAGSGSKLGDIKFIEAQISKTSASDLKVMHRILFGRIGQQHEIKKNIRFFSGFPFTADSKEFEKKKKQVDGLTTLELKLMCSHLGLERSGKKEELVDIVLNFLLHPKDEGKEPPASKRGKRSSVGAAAATSAEPAKTPAKRGRKSKAEMAAFAMEDTPDADPPELDGDDLDRSDDVKESEDEPSPKRSKVGRGRASAGRKPTGKAQLKSGKGFPSDDEIKTTIKDLLKGVNLEEVTMKEMTSKVYNAYPGVDLTIKKDFIKETVKVLLSSSD